MKARITVLALLLICSTFIVGPQSGFGSTCPLSVGSWCFPGFTCRAWGYLECISSGWNCNLGFGDCGCCDTEQGDNWPCRCLI